jgi:hypothetical protein
LLGIRPAKRYGLTLGLAGLSSQILSLIHI